MHRTYLLNASANLIKILASLVNEELCSRLHWLHTVPRLNGVRMNIFRNLSPFLRVFIACPFHWWIKKSNSYGRSSPGLVRRAEPARYVPKQFHFISLEIFRGRHGEDAILLARLRAGHTSLLKVYISLLNPPQIHCASFAMRNRKLWNAGCGDSSPPLRVLTTDTERMLALARITTL